MRDRESIDTSKVLKGELRQFPEDLTTLSLIETQVRRVPEDTALVFGDTRLTYAEVNAKANELAAGMIATGVRSGDLVPIVTANGPDLPIAMVAVMKSGAAFVPVDKDWPKERLTNVIRQLNPRSVRAVSGAISFPRALLANRRRNK